RERAGALEQAMPLAEHAREARLHAAFDHGRPAPPGMLEQVVEHRVLGALVRVELQHLAGAGVGVVQEPAGDRAAALAQQARMELAVAALAASLGEQPVERGLVIVWTERDALRGALERVEQRRGLQRLLDQAGRAAQRAVMRGVRIREDRDRGGKE